jgi:hypothetical protein
VELINAMEIREDDESFRNPIDYMFENLAEREPQHFAVRQYAKYKLAAGKVSCKWHINRCLKREAARPFAAQMGSHGKRKGAIQPAIAPQKLNTGKGPSPCRYHIQTRRKSAETHLCA